MSQPPSQVMDVPDALVLEVNGERIPITESFMDFSDFTHDELLKVKAFTSEFPLLIDGEPTPMGTATMLAIKLVRGRDWDKATFADVIVLLTAWLTDDLEEITDG